MADGLSDVLIARAAEATGRPVDQVRQLVTAERTSPGSTVSAEVARRGLEPHVWSEALVDFYKESDAFVFELLVWNEAGFKKSMRAWSRQTLLAEADRLGRRLRVLCHGDGLGLDAAAFAEDGHDVTYFEFPGASERFARRTFDEARLNIEVVTDESELGNGFDVLTSFDVLEHVPEPRETVSRYASLLADGGLLLSHAPFYLIHPAYPTHLRTSRRHAGSTRLYERAGFTLVDGNTFWNPLALRLGDAMPGAGIHRRRLDLVGLGLKVGRHTTMPFRPFQWLARRR